MQINVILKEPRIDLSACLLLASLHLFSLAFSVRHRFLSM